MSLKTQKESKKKEYGVKKVFKEIMTKNSLYLPKAKTLQTQEDDEPQKG